MRKNILAFILSLVVFTACVDSAYNIAGSAHFENFDGRMLYLRIPEGMPHSRECIDSCRVVHGRFDFMGTFDTIVMAQIIVDNETLMPVVLEEGCLHVELSQGVQRVGGGFYNDRLYQFLQKRNRIVHAQWELDREFIRLMHEGNTLRAIQHQLQGRADQLNRELELLETRFIVENADNPLGVGYFFNVFGAFPLPIMTEQLRSIMQLAPPQFLQMPSIDAYIRKAMERHNEVEASQKNWQ